VQRGWSVEGERADFGAGAAAEAPGQGVRPGHEICEELGLSPDPEHDVQRWATTLDVAYQ
jgi:hypothetical protein